MKKYKKSVEKKVKEHTTSHTQELPLSDTDRITYTFKYMKDSNRKVKIVEVVNTSYEIFINEEWMTIVRYDSAHGYLHRHARLSLDNPIDTPIPIDLSGTHADWLTWAINDIETQFSIYKKEFLTRSNI